ncbi:hypothetical protein [Streptomyces sp. NRRL F-5135]|uniref:hypothetical protein n=1 Tax=Streptomyces sp. NRRL F-5135 TaxID=1463858 RepID=UPI000B17DB69|nr:hypothetical protein [Streptomyces sp. NRRL F-5135]
MPATETGARPRRSPRSSRLLRPSRPWLRAVLALSGWAALAATALPGGSPARWIPVLFFVAVGPGCALLLPQPPAGRLRPAARMEVVALAAPLSLSLATLDATALHLVAGFSVPLFLGSLAAFCTVAALLPGLPLPAATRGAVERERPRDGRSGSRNSAVSDR